MAVRRLGDVLVELVLEHMVQMAEGLLLGDDGDVILAGVGDQFRGFGRSERAAGRRGQRLVGIEQRVLEVGRVDVDLEGGEDANLVLLEFESRKRAAGEIVLDAAIAHGRPVAHRARGQFARRPRQRKQLLEGLHAVKDAGSRGGHNGSLVGLDSHYIAFGIHGRIENQAAAGQECLGRGRAGAQQNHPVSGARRPARRALLDCILQVPGRKLVLRVMAGHADLDPCRQGCAGAKMSLAGRGQQADLGRGKG